MRSIDVLRFIEDYNYWHPNDPTAAELFARFGVTMLADIERAADEAGILQPVVVITPNNWLSANVSLGWADSEGKNLAGFSIDIAHAPGYFWRANWLVNPKRRRRYLRRLLKKRFNSPIVEASN